MESTPDTTISSIQPQTCVEIMVHFKQMRQEGLPHNPRIIRIEEQYPPPPAVRFSGLSTHNPEQGEEQQQEVPPDFRVLPHLASNLLFGWTISPEKAKYLQFSPREDDVRP
jgi:hypothetical protein